MEIFVLIIMILQIPTIMSKTLGNFKNYTKRDRT